MKKVLFAVCLSVFASTVVTAGPVTKYTLQDRDNPQIAMVIRYDRSDPRVAYNIGVNFSKGQDPKNFTAGFANVEGKLRAPVQREVNGPLLRGDDNFGRFFRASEKAVLSCEQEAQKFKDELAKFGNIVDICETEN